MVDTVDFANDSSEFLLGVALLRHLPKSPKPSAQFCEDCDDPIPLARQHAAPGCETCIDCQGLRELRR